jgi:hypothetical protein
VAARDTSSKEGTPTSVWALKLPESGRMRAKPLLFFRDCDGGWEVAVVCIEEGHRDGGWWSYGWWDGSGDWGADA